MVVVYSERFLGELKVIFDFIASDSNQRAKRFTDEIVSKLDLLPNNPFMGRAVSQTKREFIYKGYVIPYFINEDTILILGIYKANIWKP